MQPRERMVLSLMPFYPPSHNGGAEWAAHEIHRYLQREMGFRVLVASAALSASSFEGVETRPLFGAERLREVVRGCDLVITQQYYSPLAIHLARRLDKPVLHLIHSTMGREYLHEPENQRRQYVVYNAEWVAQRQRFPQPAIVVPPPVDWRRYRVETTRHYITLMNVAEAKGGAVLVEIARRLPDKRFLGVLGFRGTMVVEPGLPNLTYMDSTPAVHTVYAQTGIVLMPSVYESWGRVGVEAMASGIPVIAHPTPGLQEALADAGLFCDRDRVEDWVEAIRALDDEPTYQTVAARCLRRAQELDPADDLRRFGGFVEDILAGRV